MKNPNLSSRTTYSYQGAIKITHLLLFAIVSCYGTARAQNAKLDEIKKLIATNYTDNINDSAIMAAAIRGIMQSLDPYSQYLSPEAYQRMQERFNPESSTGIGITITSSHDTITVFQVKASSPADKVGMLPGDRIMKIGKESAIGLTRDDALGKLADPTFEGKVEVTVFRPNGERLMLFTITPREIPAEKKIVWQMLNDTTGYIRFSIFSQNINVDIHAGILSLQKQGMHSLVLDLRDNGGGLVKEAADIASEFIGGNSKLFTLQGKTPESKENYYAGDKAPFEKLPLVLLVDDGTASASELLAGALQDLDRAFIIGTQTFGKSLSQRTFPLSTGGALKLTCFRAYLPSGRLVQRRYNGSSYLAERFNFDSIMDNYDHTCEAPSVSKQFRPFLTFYGRKVYGGQGIIPDYIIPEGVLHPSTQRLFDERIFVDLTMQYLPSHAATLRNDFTVNNFMADFRAPKSVISDLESLAKQWKIEVDPKELALDWDRIEHQFAIQLAYQLFGDDAWRMPDPKKDKALALALGHQSQARKMSELADK